jgi:hypothetical protein
MATNVLTILDELQRSGFRDIAGAHVFAHVPVSRELLNRLVAQALEEHRAVRRVEIQPRPGDRFDVIVTLAWALVPPLTVAVVVDRQPELPASPTLVLRWSLAAGLAAIASQFVGALNDRLPTGVRLEGDRVLVDIAALAAAYAPLAQALPYVAALRLRTVDDRAVIDLEWRVADYRSASVTTA